MDSSSSPEPPLPDANTICETSEQSLSSEEIDSKIVGPDNSDMDMEIGFKYDSEKPEAGVGSGQGQGKDSRIKSARIEQDSLEAYAWNVFKESGLLGEIKGQLVQFLEDSGRLNMSNIIPIRVNPELLQCIFEYLTWVGMSRSAGMIVSESPVDFSTTLAEGNKAESEDSPKLVKMFTIVTATSQQNENASEVTTLKSVAASETFLVKPEPNEKGEKQITKVAVELLEPEAFEVDDQIQESDEEDVEVIFINPKKLVPSSENKQAGKVSESEKCDTSSFKFPENKVMNDKYKEKQDDDFQEIPEPEEETKSYSESFDDEDSKAESLSPEDHEQNQKIESDAEQAHQNSLEAQANIISDLKLEEKKSEPEDTHAQAFQTTSLELPEEQASETENAKSQLQGSEIVDTDGEDSMSSIMDNLTISENTDDMSINSDSVGITSCEHGIDLDRLN